MLMMVNNSLLLFHFFVFSVLKLTRVFVAQLVRWNISFHFRIIIFFTFISSPLDSIFSFQIFISPGYLFDSSTTQCSDISRSKSRLLRNISGENSNKNKQQSNSELSFDSQTSHNNTPAKMREKKVSDVKKTGFTSFLVSALFVMLCVTLSNQTSDFA